MRPRSYHRRLTQSGFPHCWPEVLKDHREDPASAPREVERWQWNVAPADVPQDSALIDEWHPGPFYDKTIAGIQFHSFDARKRPFPEDISTNATPAIIHATDDPL